MWKNQERRKVKRNDGSMIAYVWYKADKYKNIVCGSDTLLHDKCKDLCGILLC